LDQLPVVDGACVIEVSAGRLSIKFTLAHSPEQVIDHALVILGAYFLVVAWSAEFRNAYTNTKPSAVRLHCSAEAWALVALPKVEVTILATDRAGLQRLSLASTLNTVAAASTQKPHACWMVCLLGIIIMHAGWYVSLT
jgi:hypothetical protein